MGARILSLLAVLVLVAGCSSTPKDTGLVTTDNNMPVTEAAPAAPAPVEAAQGPAPGTQQDLVVNVGDRVFFGYDKYDLTADARATIEKQALWLKQYPNINIMVEGHCDERGTREYNLALGEKRATAVKNYMISLGVEAARLQTISYGKERPAAMGSDETAWSQNRRGVAVVQ